MRRKDSRSSKFRNIMNTHTLPKRHTLIPKEKKKLEETSKYIPKYNCHRLHTSTIFHCRTFFFGFFTNSFFTKTIHLTSLLLTTNLKIYC